MKIKAFVSSSVNALGQKQTFKIYSTSVFIMIDNSRYKHNCFWNAGTKRLKFISFCLNIVAFNKLLSYSYA